MEREGIASWEIDPEKGKIDGEEEDKDIFGLVCKDKVQEKI